MAFSYGFYNSVDDDRVYDAVQMSMIFDGIIEDGVYMSIGSALMVKSTDNGMVVNVGAGRAWFNHTWSYNDTELPLIISESDLLMDRIDTVVLDINSAESVRMNDIKILTGEPSKYPVGATLIKTEGHCQYPLARILVKANSNTITQDNITNLVGTSECPFVKCPLEKVSTDDLLVQWEAEFEAWFDRIKGQLSSDAAGHLQIQIDTVDSKFGGCWIEFTDLEGNPTDIPYMHWIGGYDPEDEHIPPARAFKEAIENLEANKADKEDFPFAFGIDENGNCGYIKPGETTVTPFGTGGGSTAGSITRLQMASVTGLTSTIETKVLDYDYIIQTESTGGNDASVSINGTNYLYSDVKSNPVTIDGSLELSYTNTSWTLKALTNLQNSVSGISYSQNDTIETWSYSSTINMMLKK